MTKYLFILISIVMPIRTNLAFAGGSIAGNGGGISEKNLTYAYLNLHAFIGLCLQTELCRLSERETQLLNSIDSSLQAEMKNKDQLKFVSGSEQKDFFKIDGQVRIAKTGNDVADPIFVNTDLLYKAGASAVDIPLAASILIHELGHHHGEKDHAALDTLGSKLQIILITRTERSEIWNGEISFSVIQYNDVRSDEDKKKINSIDQVLISYTDKVVNLTDEILAAFKCPDVKDSLSGLRIYNLHEDHGVTYDKKKDITHRPMSAWYISTCSPSKKQDVGDLIFDLQLRRRKPAREPEFIKDGSTVKQVSCETDRKVCK